jgi:hypothetical protein
LLVQAASSPDTGAAGKAYTRLDTVMMLTWLLKPCFLQVPNIAKQLLRMCIRSGKCQSMLLGQLGRCQRDLLDTHRELAAAKAELSSSRRLPAAAADAEAIHAQHRAELTSVQAKADQVLRREAQVGSAQKALLVLDGHPVLAC